MKRLFFIGLAVLLVQNLLAQTKVVFSQQGGFYEECFSLELDCAKGYHIRYTLNGSTPTANAACYSEPLFLDEELYSKSNIYSIVNCILSTYHVVDNVKHAIVIRAAAFDEDDNRVGPVVTHSYFIKELGCDMHGLPVLSIVADSLDLFDYETGIFVPGINYSPADSTGSGNYNMTGRDWERQINMEFYEPDNSGLNQQCGLRTHGGASRWFQQKGMRLYAREEYGQKRFKHRFFETTSLASFKRVNLHPFRCSNWLQTGGQEYLSQRVAAQLDVDGLGVRQVVVFINGEYWGIYTLEESPDERYLEDHYDVDLDQVNLIKYWGVTDYGDGEDWWSFKSWIANAEMNQTADSAYAFSRIEIPSFIDYFLLEIYGANLDWPQNNVLQWQARAGAPFRMMFFDGDGCFTRWHYQALYNAMNQGGASLIINKLMESDAFKAMLYDRYMELKKSVFSFGAMKAVWDEYRDFVEDEVPSQVERFGFPKSMQRWQSDMDSTEAFFIKRFQGFRHEMQEVFKFNLPMVNGNMVYPNPNNGTFFIRILSESCALMNVEVIDVMGKRLHEEDCFLTPGENIFQVETDLRSGLYLVKMGDIVKRIVIQ